METAIDRLIALDKAIFFSINGTWISPALDIVMVFITLFGNGLFLAGIVAPILYFGDRRHFSKRAPAIIAAVVVGGVVNNLIKELVGRPRPLIEFSEEIRTGAVWVHTVFEQWHSNSFPSGHAQTAFGTATALAYYYRGWYTPLTFVLAGAVAISRVYLGVHFPLDAVVGALVGVGFSLGTCRAWERGRIIYRRRRKEDPTAG
jgi:undecaprenyl-diphosphatase